jgi:ferredoxin
MAQSRRWLKNDPDRRMLAVVQNTRAFFPEKDIQALDRRNLDHWIAELRKGEADVRRLRIRLEALQAEVDRPCRLCGRPVAGRADAIYCTSECRVRAHRKARQADAEGRDP